MQACRVGVRAMQTTREGAWTTRTSGSMDQWTSGRGIERVKRGEQEGERSGREVRTGKRRN